MLFLSGTAENINGTINPVHLYALSNFQQKLMGIRTVWVAHCVNWFALLNA